MHKATIRDLTKATRAYALIDPQVHQGMEATQCVLIDPQVRPHHSSSVAPSRHSHQSVDPQGSEFRNRSRWESQKPKIDDSRVPKDITRTPEKTSLWKWAKQDAARSEANWNWRDTHPERQGQYHEALRKRTTREEAWEREQHNALQAQQAQQAQEERERRTPRDRDDKGARDKRARERSGKGGGLLGFLGRR
ncbi:hypothetical protein F5X97DRAFT_324404 [Nemania serpens]|nr:hypothetical protein F5X97DRAFT_324404 [Nemania serpens]